MSHFDKKIYFIVGPTASGKTSLSLDLAKKVDGEIVSADSRQIYRDFDLSSGKVTKEEMGNIPHHMIDIINPGEKFSVFEYTNMALSKIEEIFERGKTPIVCGGTGFYIDNLLFDYKLPNVEANEALREELKQKTASELFEILRSMDKSFSQEVDKNNRIRLIRAIEICKFYGYVPPLKKVLRFKNFEIIETKVEREKLRERIFERLMERINAGMIDEIKNVRDKYNLSYKYLESLGLEFKWVTKLLQKEISKEIMIERLNLEICQYARRQDTWFRRYKNLK